MNADGKSDGSVVPAKRANNAAEAPAESAEGRDSAKRNAKQANLDRTQKRKDRRSSGLPVCANGSQGPPAQVHGPNAPRQRELLRSSFLKLKKTAAVGVDEVTWQEYERTWKTALRISTVAFIAEPTGLSHPSECTLTKADGASVHWASPSLEDKIVQHAVRAVLRASTRRISRFQLRLPARRTQHQALDALYVAITEKSELGAGCRYPRLL